MAAPSAFDDDKPAQPAKPAPKVVARRARRLSGSPPPQIASTVQRMRQLSVSPVEVRRAPPVAGPRRSPSPSPRRRRRSISPVFRRGPPASNALRRQRRLSLSPERGSVGGAAAADDEVDVPLPTLRQVQPASLSMEARAFQQPTRLAFYVYGDGSAAHGSGKENRLPAAAAVDGASAAAGAGASVGAAAPIGAIGALHAVESATSLESRLMRAAKTLSEWRAVPRDMLAADSSKYRDSSSNNVKDHLVRSRHFLLLLFLCCLLVGGLVLFCAVVV